MVDAFLKKTCYLIKHPDFQLMEAGEEIGSKAKMYVIAFGAEKETEAIMKTQWHGDRPPSPPKSSLDCPPGEGDGPSCVCVCEKGEWGLGGGDNGREVGEEGGREVNQMVRMFSETAPVLMSKVTG